MELGGFLWFFMTFISIFKSFEFLFIFLIFSFAFLEVSKLFIFLKFFGIQIIIGFQKNGY